MKTKNCVTLIVIIVASYALAACAQAPTEEAIATQVSATSAPQTVTVALTKTSTSTEIATGTPVGTPSPENSATVPPMGVPVTGSPEIPTEESSKISEASATATEKAKGELPDWARPYFADKLPEGAVDGTKLTDDQLRKMGITAKSNAWVKCGIPKAYATDKQSNKVINGFKLDLNKKGVCYRYNKTDAEIDNYIATRFPNATPDRKAYLKKRYLGHVKVMEDLFTDGKDRYMRADVDLILQKHGDTIDWLVFTNPYPGNKEQFVGVLDIPLPDVAATETPLSTATAGATETQKAAETAPGLPSWLQGWFFEEPPEGSIILNKIKGDDLYNQHISATSNHVAACGMPERKKKYGKGVFSTVWGIDLSQKNGEVCVTYPKTDKDINDYINSRFKSASPERKAELIQRYKDLAQAFQDAFPEGKDYYFDASTRFILQKNGDTVDWCVFRTDGNMKNGTFLQVLNVPLPQK